MFEAEAASGRGSQDLPSVFVLLADSLHPEFDVIDTMDVLVDASTRFTSAVGAGILLADGNEVLHVVASTSKRTSDVEEVQLRAGEGPGVETARTGVPLHISDLTVFRQRWPRFTEVAADRGFRALHTFPLSVRNTSIGALNLFSDRVGTLKDTEAALVRAFAQIATIAVLQQQSLQQHTALSTHLQRALESRVLIEQAKGMLAHQHRITIDQAFRMLRTHARSNNTRLHDVAEEVVSLRLTL